MAGNGVGGDGEPTDLEVLAVFHGFTVGDRLRFGGKGGRLGLFTDAIEFQDMVAVTVGKNDFHQVQLVALQGGKKRIRIRAGIHGHRLEGGRVPNQVVVDRQIRKRCGEHHDARRQSDGGGLPIFVGHGGDLFRPQPQGAREPFQGSWFTPTGADGIEFRDRDVSRLAEIAVGDALSLLGLSEDVENTVFQLHGRRTWVAFSTVSAGTGNSLVPTGRSGSSNQERQPDSPSAGGRCQTG